MAEFVIDCAVFARLTSVLRWLPPEADEWTNSVRIEDGRAICSNRRVLAMEEIQRSNVGIVHIKADPILIKQCQDEAKFDGKLNITVIPELKMASAKTTFGWNYPGNAAVFSDNLNKMDYWRDVVPKEPATKSTGGMFWQTDMIIDLANSSPSGRLVFEKYIDVGKPTVIRDVNDPHWMGVFMPNTTELQISPATILPWVHGGK